MDKRLTNEIGSEFWLPDLNNDVKRRKEDKLIDLFLPNRKECQYVLSGRTAIDLICKDINKFSHKKKVYLPAYCCDSMIFPITDNGFSVELYDMSIGCDGVFNYIIDENKEIDIFYINNYFGYPNSITIEHVKKLKDKGIIIIYDRTHSLFLTEDPFVELADYSFSSIRKWCSVVTGAIVAKHNGKSFDFSLNKCLYTSYKHDAMELKRRFIYDDNTIIKDVFFELFNEFNIALRKDYSLYTIDDNSLEILDRCSFDSLRKKRCENANYLYDNLKDCDISFYYGSPQNLIPLFVPVFFSSKEKRDKVRKHLIENEIYCPIHWPKNALINQSMKVNDIYERELSLVCDQRYDIGDMKRIVNNIKQII